MNKSTFEQEINNKGSLTYTFKGVSMLPLLRQNRDLITIIKPHGRLKKYDVALYRRNNDFVLHRVVEVRENDYVILGDNCISKEYGITDDKILGVMSSFVRNGKEISVNNKLYCCYSIFWYKIYSIRKIIKISKIKIKKIAKFILHK